MILRKYGGKGSLTKWISHEAVYRTAPATPGMLKKLGKINKSQNIMFDDCTIVFLTHKGGHENFSWKGENCFLAQISSNLGKHFTKWQIISVFKGIPKLKTNFKPLKRMNILKYIAFSKIILNFLFTIFFLFLLLALLNKPSR